MPAKIPIHPGRIRQVPKQFNWIDGAWCVTATLTSAAIPLLPSILFLITVSDAQGLSYYSDQSIGQIFRQIM